MSNLIHAVSRVRAREDRLLTASHVSRMIDAPTFQEAYSVLDDLGHADEASRQRASGDFEEVLENALHETLQIFSHFGLDKKLSVLTVREDIQNCTLALKSFRQGEEKGAVENLLISYASLSPREISALVFSATGDPELLSFISVCKAEKENQKMEEMIESFFFYRARKISGTDIFLLKYLDLLASSNNVKKDVVTLSSSEILKKYSGSDLLPLLQLGLKKQESQENFSFLEILFDERNLRFLQQEARGEIDGYAPLFSFFWKQERNTRVIRSLLLAKRNNISSEKIRAEFDTFIF